MSELFSERKIRIDALDTLREWVIKDGPNFGQIRPTIFLNNSRCVRIEIQRGDELVSLEKDTQV